MLHPNEILMIHKLTMSSERHLDETKPINHKELKRARYEAKRQGEELQRLKETQQEEWIQQHSHYCTRVTVADVEKIKSQQQEQNHATHHDSLAVLLTPYLDLKDGKNKSQQKQLFIAEGTETVRLLTQQCAAGSHPIQVLSVLIKPTLLLDPPVKLITDIQATIESNNNAPPFRVLIASEEAQSACAGFHISRGALACGIVPNRTQEWLQEYIESKKRQSSFSLRILALDGISDTANMGSMIRCAAAFGVDAMVLSHDCCDAWYRRSVRVSMGHIFYVPIVRVKDLSGTIQQLRDAHTVPSYAAVVRSKKGLLILEDVERGSIPPRWCCVVGNEANGISEKVIQACTHELCIGMVSGVDSLSVPIATGILLHGFKERERQMING